MHLGEKIKQLRRAKGLTQKELSELMEYGNTTISNWEVNKSTPSVDDLIKLAKVLDVSVEILTANQDLQLIDIAPKGNYHNVPFLSTRAYASFVDLFGQYQYDVKEKRPVYFPPGQKYKPTQIVIEISGESMRNSVRSGALVLFEEVADSNIEYINSGIFAIVFDSQFTIKMVKENELQTKGYLTLYSDDDSGAHFIVKRELIRKVWRAIKIVEQYF